jgi:hypothetical protein
VRKARRAELKAQTEERHTIFVKPFHLESIQYGKINYPSRQVKFIFNLLKLKVFGPAQQDLNKSFIIQLLFSKFQTEAISLSDGSNFAICTVSQSHFCL